MDSLTLEDLSLNIMVENDSMAISLDTPGVLPNSLDVLGQNITEDIDSIARLPLRLLGFMSMNDLDPAIVLLTPVVTKSIVR